MNRILRLDLASKRANEEVIRDEYRFLGGRGLTSTLLSDEVDPLTHPLGSENKLIVAPGLLAGTALSSSNRLSVGAKSPLTGGIKEANSGGNVGFKLARVGVRAVVLEGKVERGTGPMVIKVSREGVSFIETPRLAGHTTYDTTREIQEEYGRRVGIMVIGPAGEMRLPSALISVTDPEGYPSRSLGRGGMGAVMGSKGVKAIVVDDDGVRDVGGPEVSSLCRKFAGMLKSNPVTGQLFAKYGTARTLAVVNALGGLPTMNFSRGQFDGAEDISGEALHDAIVRRVGEKQLAHACMPGCMIRCSKNFYDEHGSVIAHSFEYETLCLLGTNIGIGNLQQIAILNGLCNEYGIDTMETGAALGVLAEAGLFDFGDFEAMKAAIQEIGKGSALGRLLGSGCIACGKAYGVERVPAIKGQGMAAYDPRAIKGNGVTYASSPMGADHTAGNTITASGIDHRDPKGKVELSLDLQVKAAIHDMLGMCIFTGRVLFADPAFLEEALWVIRGLRLRFDELERIGADIICRERAFNHRAGLGTPSDSMPEFMRTEPLPPFGPIFDVPNHRIREMFDKMCQQMSSTPTSRA